MREAPYVSFVVVGRNDSYGGGFANRLETFINSVQTFVNRHEIGSEIVVVEWNPEEGKVSLNERVGRGMVRGRYGRVRILEVSRDIHVGLRNPAQLPVFEYLGKNVGIRRSCGEFVAVTNGDVIVSESLVEAMARGNLRSDRFYRVNRRDVRKLPQEALSVDEIVEHCARNVICVRRQGYTDEGTGSWPKKWKNVLYRSAHLMWRGYAPLHFNASGDFILMKRERWEELRGFPELETEGSSHHIDGLAVYMAKFSGLRQKILKEPLFHQEHEGRERQREISSAVKALMDSLRKTRKAVVVNDPEWGLGRERLREWELS